MEIVAASIWRHIDLPSLLNHTVHPGGRRLHSQKACIYLAVHPAQAALLNDEVAGRLQEVGAEVALLDVIVLIAAVSRPGPGPDRRKHSIWD